MVECDSIEDNLLTRGLELTLTQFQTDLKEYKHIEFVSDHSDLLDFKDDLEEEIEATFYITRGLVNGTIY